MAPTYILLGLGSICLGANLGAILLYKRFANAYVAMKVEFS
ncbi:hypothetical protein COO91_09210 (plasmid) [Nostoc flagelliforme CCNUN1]|uniref:Uncharacterized protein n=2 Tax=Nostoc flagelliforme TaxID=1306274 RepID=A0A2K8T5S9_9NOSO|nr:hypothetical protein COO91_09210 [Nostoc flagelliforme CCNUN1]